MKKITTIIAIIVVIIILVVLGWLFFSGGDQETGVQEEKPGFFANLFSNNETIDLGGDGVREPPSSSDSGGFGFNFLNQLIKREIGDVVLQQLTTFSVSGIIATTTSGTVSVRYVERQTGNTHEIDPETLETMRLTNTTIPGVYEAVWSKDAVSVILRYLDENDVIKTFMARIMATSSSSMLDGRFLPNDIDLLISDDIGENIFYTIRGDINTLLKKSTFNGAGVSTVYRSLLHELLYEVTNIGDIFFTTKASGLVSGFVYRLSIGDDALPEKILGPIRGLTVNASPTGDIILFSESVGGGFGLSSFEIDTRDERLVSVTTLPEKCVWSPVKSTVVYCGVPSGITNGLYPDDWYKGKVSFSDSVWEIDVSKDTTRLLVDTVSGSGSNFDLINPTMSEFGDYLFFINKKDSTLWSLRLGK